MRTIHHLNALEREQLIYANRLLTEITERHAHWCECFLCEARWRTDVQDEASFHEPCEMDVGVLSAAGQAEFKRQADAYAAQVVAALGVPPQLIGEPNRDSLHPEGL